MRTIAHDITNPISGILSTWSLTIDQLSKIKWKTWSELEDAITNIWWAIQMIIKSAKDAMELVNELKPNPDWKISSKIKLEKEKFDFRLFLLQITSDHIYYVSENKKNIKISFEKDCPKIKINGDKNQLKRVFKNIIWNAIKYTNKEKWEINISYFIENQIVKILISDNGDGILVEDIPKIFDFETRVGDTESQEWSWIWLFITKNIIELHWWTVSVKSPWPWLWSTFTICLPALSNSDLLHS